MKGFENKHDFCIFVFDFIKIGQLFFSAILKTMFVSLSAQEEKSVIRKFNCRVWDKNEFRVVFVTEKALERSKQRKKAVFKGLIGYPTDESTTNYPICSYELFKRLAKEGKLNELEKAYRRDKRTEVFDYFDISNYKNLPFGDRKYVYCSKTLLKFKRKMLLKHEEGKVIFSPNILEWLVSKESTPKDYKIRNEIIDDLAELERMSTDEFEFGLNTGREYNIIHFDDFNTAAYCPIHNNVDTIKFRNPGVKILKNRRPKRSKRQRSKPTTGTC